MALGKKVSDWIRLLDRKEKERRNKIALEPLRQSVESLESRCTCRIQIQVANRLLDWGMRDRAFRIYQSLRATELASRKLLFLYFNIARNRFVIVADPEFRQVDPNFFSELRKILEEDFRSTHPSKALEMVVATLDQALPKYFPS